MLPSRKELNDAFSTILRLVDYCEDLQGSLQKVELTLKERERYVGISEAASMLGVTRQTVNRYLRTGVLSVSFRGKKRVIKESEILKIENKQS